MTYKNYQAAFYKIAAFIFGAAFLISGGAFDGFSQIPPQNTDSIIKNTDEKIVEETIAAPVISITAVKAESEIKVVFDEAVPGVVYIVANGEKIRVDTNKKSVEPMDIDAPAETVVSPKVETTAKVEPKTEPEGDGEYDFDSGEEPFDYRIINVPTPKKVPKGSLNMSFSHRFSQPIHPIRESARNLLGFDSFSVSSFSLSYGITDKLYVSASRSPLCQRGLCRTVELGIGYQWLEQTEKSPIALNTYASIEGNGNFTEEYNYNLQTMISRRVGKRVYLFFSPAIHLNANGQKRFNPRPEEFFPPATIANNFKLPTHTVSYGFGTTVLITPNVVALFEFVPRTGFKFGSVTPIFDNNFRVLGFQNKSQPSIGFGIQRNLGKHSFALTFSNTQTTTTSRYNSSNLLLSPRRYIFGFNLFRRFN